MCIHMVKRNHVEIDISENGITEKFCVRVFAVIFGPFGGIRGVLLLRPNGCSLKRFDEKAVKRLSIVAMRKTNERCFIIHLLKT